jgi:glycosyltransferase involved in cell wall biosynthesis
MTRILYCIDAMGPGGTERQLASLIRGLDRQRFTPLLCTLKPSMIELSALPCATLELPFSTFRRPGTLTCLHQLRRFVRTHNVDIIQAFFQDPTLLAFLGSGWTSVRARIASFRDMGFWRTRAKVAQLRLVYPRFDGFIANSRAVARQAHQLDGLPLDKFEIIPNGVRMPPERPRNERAATPVVGIVAHLNRPVKRVDLFLDVAAYVRRAIDCTFVVVGDGPLRPALEARAAQLGIARQVRFAGAVPDTTEHVRLFDVGVVCSDSEGLPNAILEYMAAGVPTVARDVGGNGEALVHNETGLLVGSDTPAAIGDAILALLADDRRRASMSSSARQFAERTFSMPVCVERHEAYYERVLTQAAGSNHGSR